MRAGGRVNAEHDARLHEALAPIEAQAQAFFNAGRMDAAQALWERVLKIDPGNARARGMLGLCAQSRGDHVAAAAHLQQAAALVPDEAEIHNALGVSLKYTGRQAEALAAFERAAALRPDDGFAAFNAGTVLLMLDRTEEAAAYFERAARTATARPDAQDAQDALAQIRRSQGRYDEAADLYASLAAEDPDNPRWLFGVSEVLIQADRPEAALPHCLRAVELAPENPAYLTRLGDALHLVGRNEEAIFRYEVALALDPHDACARNNLGAALKVLGRYDQAGEEFARCLELDPDNVPALVNLGVSAKEQGDARRACGYFERASRLSPDDLSLKLYHTMCRIPFAYEDEEEIEVCREAYAHDLADLFAAAMEAAPGALAGLARSVGRLQPYYLPYQGRCDRELMTRYGRIIHRAVNAAFAYIAEEAAKALPSPPGPGERIRVGFVSGHFYEHSVWKLPVKGWAAGLDRERFKVAAYSVSTRTDCETEAARRIFDAFHEGLLTLEALARAVRRDAPHILVYPELGMDPLCVRAACLRLAPVQCVSWGHPETSGLPTMDYFLSSDLMEPPDGREHYSERLVRLPGLGVAYLSTPPAPGSDGRADFGLSEEDAVYLCLQTLYKYLPRQDGIFAAIAARVPKARFVFLENSGAMQLNSMFRARLEHAFSAAGLDPGERLVFLPPLPGPRFQALARLGDIFLDSFEWSGCNSSLETMAYGVPAVTLPGRFMRGRHTAAFLSVMGLPELIAASEEDYVDKAARLGLDVEHRLGMSRLVRERIGLCYEGFDAVRGLEDFFEDAARGAR